MSKRNQNKHYLVKVVLQSETDYHDLWYDEKSQTMMIVIVDPHETEFDAFGPSKSWVRRHVQRKYPNANKITVIDAEADKKSHEGLSSLPDGPPAKKEPGHRTFVWRGKISSEYKYPQWHLYPNGEVWYVSDERDAGSRSDVTEYILRKDFAEI